MYVCVCVCINVLLLLTQKDVPGWVNSTRYIGITDRRFRAESLNCTVRGGGLLNVSELGLKK